MQIRAFDEADTEQVVSLWRLCGLTRPWNDPYLDIARKLTVQRELFLIGVDDTAGRTGAVIATAMGGYEGHRGWVNYLAVGDRRPRRASALASRRRPEMALAQSSSAQVRGDNTEALAFYAAIGYGVDDAVSLGKRLIADAG